MEEGIGTPTPSSSAAEIIDGIGPSGPSCWGPPQWTALHQLLRGYPRQTASKEKQEALRAYVTGLAGLIPCNSCAQHWKAFAETVQTKNRTDALKWSIDVHNAVNARLGKHMYTYPEAIQELKAQCPNNGYKCSFPTEPNDQTFLYGITIVTLITMLVAVVTIVVAAVVLQKSGRAVSK